MITASPEFSQIDFCLAATRGVPKFETVRHRPAILTAPAMRKSASFFVLMQAHLRALAVIVDQAAIWQSIHISQVLPDCTNPLWD